MLARGVGVDVSPFLSNMGNLLMTPDWRYDGLTFEGAVLTPFGDQNGAGADYVRMAC